MCLQKWKKITFFFVLFLEKCLVVTIVTGQHDPEVSWDIKPTAGGDSVCGKLVSVGNNPSGNPTECCFTSSGEYTITCDDGYGDGWNGYQVRFDGVEKCAGFDSGAQRTDTFTIEVAGNLL